MESFVIVWKNLTVKLHERQQVRYTVIRKSENWIPETERYETNNFIIAHIVLALSKLNQ